MYICVVKGVFRRTDVICYSKTAVLSSTRSIKLKLIFKILALSFFVTNTFGQNSASLYPITNDNLWGYIDNSGKTVIKPQYLYAGQFSEGLSAVRLKGTYGYIDKSDNFVIAPQYDFALPFQCGQAKVFIDGKPYFIDKNGKITFQHNFKSISSFQNRTFAIAITETDKYCLIGRNGMLLTDSVFKKIYSFNDGVAVVYGLNHLKDSSQIEMFETGVIDTTGKWMIHYGTYKDIESFKNGYSSAVRFKQTEEESGWSREDAVIDKNGNLKFILPVGKYFLDFDNTGFNNDLAVVHIYPENSVSTESFGSNDEKEYKGVINTDGVILFSDTNWQKITPFKCNSAFVQDKNEKWKMINTKGEQVCDSTFNNILYQNYGEIPDDIFSNGIAWVKLSNGWVQIDTAGKILSRPKIFEGINDNRLYRVGDIIFVEEDISVENPDYSFRYGFWNSKTDASVSPIYHDIDRNGFNNDLIYAMKDGRNYYINSNGKIIWQEKESKTTAFANLNIDYMNRGYFYAYSKPSKSDPGGFGGSDNVPKKISKSNNFQPKTLSIVVHPELKDTIYRSINAITLYIGNTTDDKINFKAQDSRIYMKVQALNSKGEWKDIEYLPNSWCGNSYHNLTLESKHFWKFLTPIYEGEFKTKLRIELNYIDPTDKSEYMRDKKEITIYSNEYEGSINPGQFWNKREYYPSGLMDPYND